MRLVLGSMSIGQIRSYHKRGSVKPARMVRVPGQAGFIVIGMWSAMRYAVLWHVRCVAEGSPPLASLVREPEQCTWTFIAPHIRIWDYGSLTVVPAAHGTLGCEA